MEMIAKESHLEKADVGTVVALGMDESRGAKLLRMLSDDLYSDPHMSILGEYCSNARDSHYEAGKLDTPFTIIAPSAEHPMLRVCDCGIGLTYEKACSTVLMFLGSTKDTGEHAKDTVGGYGIGAKTARAYTSTYEIVMRKDGVECHVMVFDNENSEPVHTVLYERKTCKSDGLEMILPVELADVNRWREKIRLYMSNTNYNVMAYMGEGEVIVPEKPFQTFEYDGFYLDVVKNENINKRSNPDTTREIRIAYGGRKFDILPAFGAATIQREIAGKLAPQYTLNIRVERADLLTFSLSREALSVNPKNQGFISKALRLIRDEVTAPEALVKVMEQNKSFDKWSDVLSASQEYQEMLDKSEVASRLGHLTHKSGAAAYFTLPGLMSKELHRGEWRIVPTKLYTALPIQQKQKLVVLYSKGRPLKSDFASFVGFNEIAIVYGERCSDVEQVKAWACNENTEGLELEYREVFSTRGKGSGGGGGSRAPFITDLLTGDKVKLVESTTWVVLTNPEQVAYAALLAGFRDRNYRIVYPEKKRDFSDYDQVISFEEYAENREVESVIGASYRGWDTPQETVAAAVRAYNYIARLAKVSGLMPRSVQDARGDVLDALAVVDAKVRAARIAYERANSLYEKLTGNSLKLPSYTLNVQKWLEKANELVYIVNKNMDVFAAVDIDRIAQASRNGNTYAAGLLTTLQLEQFV